MVTHGQELACAGAKPIVRRLDAATEPLPHAAGSVHLVSMSSVLHVIDEPSPCWPTFAACSSPVGIFLLNDWIRQPLAAYLAYRRDVMGEDEAESFGAAFASSPSRASTRRTTGSGCSAKAGFTIRHRAQLRPSHQILVTVPDGTG